MSRKISFFTDYHQNENSITNYCGLMLKILYQESPRKFEQVLNILTAGEEELDLTIGPIFNQQLKNSTSIPDLSIVQDSFAIYFETKLNDWFYNEQLIRHINGFNGNQKYKILFLLSNFEKKGINKIIKNAKHDALKNDKIHIIEITFEELVASLENVFNTENLQYLFEEFKEYLDRNSLFPKWKYMLDVVNCFGTKKEIESNVYICPNTGGSYSHQHAKYFGAYWGKKVNYLFEIDAVVIVNENCLDAHIAWINNGELNEEDLKKKAVDIIKRNEWRLNENSQKSLQVFFLSNRRDVSFVKESAGGMFGSKKYFKDIASDCITIDDLANKINNKCWGDFNTNPAQLMDNNE